MSIYTVDEIKDILIARYDPDMVLDLLDPDIEELVDGLHEVICIKQEQISKLLIEGS